MNEENTTNTGQTEPIKHKCQHCNEAEFDTAAQLRGHQMKCRPKQETQQSEPNQVAKRQERIPFGVPKLRFEDVPKNDSFHYRVFNDNWRKEPGRVQRALRAGYEVVEHHQSGQNVGTNDDGTEIKGVLMRIPQELWEQDQALKEESRGVVDAQIYRGKHTAQKGDGRYVPGEGIKIETN